MKNTKPQLKVDLTICSKIDECEKILNEAFKAQSLNVLELFELLKKMRYDAQHMEDGLRERKRVMMEHGLEDSYQKSKSTSHSSQGINKINTDKVKKTPSNQTFKVVVTDMLKEEVVYEGHTVSGIISLVENFEDIDENGYVRGNVQTFTYGKPLQVFYAYDQLMKRSKPNREHLLTEVSNLVSSGKIKDPEFKKQLMEAQGGTI